MNTGINAIVAEKNAADEFTVGLKILQESDLPNESVLVEIDYSTFNYKDGLACTNASPICQKFPMVCGIDLAGTVTKSHNVRFNPGDKVLANGFGLSERYWGGFSQKQRVNPDFLLKIPEAFTTKQAMALGTAGYTAMLCVNAVRDHGTKPKNGPVLVTGSAGGVGSVAIMLLSRLGYDVIASTGRPETAAYLHEIGAHDILDRTKLSRKSSPLEGTKWAAVVDAVGSTTIATALAQTKYNGVVACCGIAGGINLPGSMLPFILRNVRLQGCDSVMAPMAVRERAWNDLANLIDIERLEKATTVKPMSRVPELAKDILQGHIKGRTVIDVNS